jgi:hypothetical protein
MSQFAPGSKARSALERELVKIAAREVNPAALRRMDEELLSAVMDPARRVKIMLRTLGVALSPEDERALRTDLFNTQEQGT